MRSPRPQRRGGDAELVFLGLIYDGTRSSGERSRSLAGCYANTRRGNEWKTPRRASPHYRFSV